MMGTVKLTQSHVVFCFIWMEFYFNGAVSTPGVPIMVLFIITLGRFCTEREYGTASCTGADYSVPLVRDRLQFHVRTSSM